ncbi:MAG: serine hydrolase, partial [Phycisphaerales bacterium]|nr:serine hydrolase [Phycisphaerales bacterium]
GGWISNVDDLAGFASGLMGDELISDESKQIMWVEQSTINGNGTGYGLGFGVSHQDEPSGQMGSQSNEDKLKIAHSGAQEKTRTLMVIYPGQRHGIVVMTNSEYANPRKFIAAIDQAIKDPMKIAE